MYKPLLLADVPVYCNSIDNIEIFKNLFNLKVYSSEFSKKYHNNLKIFLICWKSCSF